LRKSPSIIQNFNYQIAFNKTQVLPRGEIGNSELPELTDLPKKFGYKVTQKISVT